MAGARQGLDRDYLPQQHEQFSAISQPGMMQAGIRSLAGVVIIGGGLVVESGGSLVGAIGLS
jgi:uncharacterized protein GlcG (DUF336 family)